MIDFTNCKVIPWMTYGGASGNKIAVEYMHRHINEYEIVKRTTDSLARVYVDSKYCK